MHKKNWWILRLAATSLALFAASAGAATDSNVKARLISEVRSVTPGASLRVALEFDIREGWHTYWRNPGDSGKPTTINWSLPPGFSAGPILWTAPHRFELPPLVNFGYANHAMHVVRIEAPRDLKPGTTVELRANASWLVCADVCIPESADVRLKLPVSAAPAAIDNKQAPLFAAADRDMPIPAAAVVSAKLADGHLLLTLGPEWGERSARIKTLEFLPYDDGMIEYAAPQTLERKSDGLELTLKAADPAPAKGPVQGLLMVSDQDGATPPVPMEISAPLAIAGSASLKATTAPAPPPQSLGLLLLFAVAGGLILNLMPCVFPVLSIKAIGLVEQAKRDPAAVRAKGLVFAAGVILSMLALAGALLALRAGGEQIGWGFQLQSPLFVTLMVYLLLLVGLNLSGVFEIGGGLAGVGDSLTQGSGYRASFFTGVLTTLVATPCTAPFMAAAVGAALTQSALVALGIFAALGLGLALPYLLLSFAPGLRSALPKPGAWMDTLKQIFAFPMYASAAWLLWVLAQQTSMGLAAAFAGAILVAFCVWSLQKSRSSSGAGRRIALAAAILAGIVAIALPVQVAHTLGTSTHVQSSSTEEWQPYDAAKVAALAASGKPVLVNFTASWCLTCLFNERNAFHDASVQAIFRAKGVTLVMADWTNSDPVITAALASFGRAGVPLYVVYNATPGSTQPAILPQLLTAGIVADAFVALPDRSGH
jgi:thiol:disulfide interchange protein/DsbC/DsbD-like thiol-disulfide interchange protein